GDSLGRILFIDVTLSSALTLLHWWQAHNDGGGVNRIAVEKETIATVGDHAALYVWTSSGAYLGNVWGRYSTCISVPADQTLPEWLDEELLIGEGSVLLRRQSSRENRNIGSSGSLMRVARTVSIVERVARLSKLRLVGFDQRSNASTTLAGSQLLNASTEQAAAGATTSSTPSMSVSRSLNFSDDGTVGFNSLQQTRRVQTSRKSQVLLDHQLPSVSFAQSIGSGAGFDEDVEFQTSFDASRRSSVAPTLTKNNSGAPRVLATSPPTSNLCVPMPTASDLLDVITPRSGDDDESDADDQEGQRPPFLFKVATSAGFTKPENIHPPSLSTTTNASALPLPVIGAHHHLGEASSSSTSSPHDQSTSLSTTATLLTHLRPLAWKANDVAALDAAFRDTLGQQRIFSCASQVLGQPNTMRRTMMLPLREASAHPAEVGNMLQSDGGSQQQKPRKSTVASIATTMSESKPRLTITLQRSGNIVTSP
ncbi:Hypothetical protein, putative, partial [Bodo saltans]